MALAKCSNSVPSLFDRFFDDDMYDWGNPYFVKTKTALPSVNVKEDEKAYELEVAVPGFDKNDFKVEVDNNVLTISSEKQEEHESKDKEDKKYNRKEFSYQSFSRSFALPDNANTDDIKASYDKGILNIHIPKKEEEKPKASRAIDIK